MFLFQEIANSVFSWLLSPTGFSPCFGRAWLHKNMNKIRLTLMIVNFIILLSFFPIFCQFRKCTIYFYIVHTLYVKFKNYFMST